MCSDFRKAESGTELLARLEGRSSLKEIEPNLFADEDSPAHGSHYAVQAGLKLTFVAQAGPELTTVLLPPPPECWDYRPAPPCPAFCDILEFHGAEGTGKTEMLYHLTARCILPKSEGGLGLEVLFIDTDHHFDMLRLVTILEHRLSQSSEEMIMHCLRRFFLVYCNSSTQLLLTLHSLEAVLCSHPSLCVLLLDSLSAFYWTDHANGGESISAQESTLRKCAQRLERLVQDYRLVLFATTQSIMQKAWHAPEGTPSTCQWHGRPDLDYRP